MKKFALFVLAALIVASPAAAQMKKKAKKAPPAPAAKQIDSNEASARLVRDSLPLWLPAPLKFVYFESQKSKAPEKAKPKKKAR
jgi:hypothetical protein